jgi:hypothetical protein
MGIPPISLANYLHIFEHNWEPDGDLKFKIKTDAMLVEGRLSMKHFLVHLGQLVVDVHTMALNGDSFVDTPFAKAGIKIHPNAGKNTPEEAVAMLNRFIQEAAFQAIRSILIRISKQPAQAVIEGVISVVLDMEENEIISIEGSRADIWNEYTDSSGRTIKRELDVPVVVKPRRWTKPMRRKALRLYEDTHKLLRDLKKTYFSTSSAKIRKQQPDLKSWEEVKAEHAQLTKLLKDLANGDRPRDLALDYVGEILGSYSAHTTWDQIMEARRERKQALKSRENT